MSVEREGSSGVGDEVTVGLDIGTGSVKAVAVDAEGRVQARARVTHPVVTAEGRLEHVVNRAWRRNVRAAWRAVAADREVRGVQVAAMVPSLAAVNRRGAGLTPGLLYGDERSGTVPGESPATSGELLGLLRWCSAAAPDAHGYWPAQAVANHALCGVGAIDTVTAMTAVPLFDLTTWDGEVARSAGARVDQLPDVVSGTQPIGELDGALVGPGTVDALAEQLVAGATEVGDVLVICGTTLITWVVLDEWCEVPGLWTVPHSVPGKVLVGGPSNAGGLFLDWVDRQVAVPSGEAAPEHVPVWSPYLRGERTPLHDPERRAALHDVGLATGAAEIRRAAHEASGFVVRHHLDLVRAATAGREARRVVATGGGVRDADWMAALADATGLPVDVVASPEGAALGAAYLARVTAGLEPSADGAGRWSRTAQRVEPDPRWRAGVETRYERFRARAGGPGRG